MKTFQSSTWKILTDASKYTTWNQTVDKMEGHIAAGEKVTVYARLSPGRAVRVKVTEFVPERKMVWAGGMPLGLFKSARSIPNLQPAFDEFAASLKERAEAGVA